MWYSGYRLHLHNAELAMQEHASVVASIKVTYYKLGNDTKGASLHLINILERHIEKLAWIIATH